VAAVSSHARTWHVRATTPDMPTARLVSEEPSTTSASHRAIRAVSLTGLMALLVILVNLVVFVFQSGRATNLNATVTATLAASPGQVSADATRALENARAKSERALMVSRAVALVSIPLLIAISLWFHRSARRIAPSRIEDEERRGDVGQGPDEKVHARTAELTQLSRHLIRVAEEEKAELARELHDTFGSNLTAINMDLNWIAKRLPAERPELKDRLQRALGMLGATVGSTQEAIDRLRPSQLDNLGLAVALQSLCRELTLRVGLACQVEAPEDFVALDRTKSITLYRVAQEALANVAKHAQAANVEVELRREGSGIRLRIWDDGIGLPEEITSPSHGMACMRERIEALGGTLNVTGAHERGTLVNAFIPGNVP
jgi:signal transduction histidine kinase